MNVCTLSESIILKFKYKCKNIYDSLLSDKRVLHWFIIALLYAPIECLSSQIEIAFVF